MEAEQRVTPLELFFDLVFVFAFTQVTALMADDPTAGVAAAALSGGVALAVVAVACAALVAYETLRYRDARMRIRHPQEAPA